MTRIASLPASSCFQDNCVNFLATGSVPTVSSLPASSCFQDKCVATKSLPTVREVCRKEARKSNQAICNVASRLQSHPSAIWKSSRKSHDPPSVWDLGSSLIALQSKFQAVNKSPIYLAAGTGNQRMCQPRAHASAWEDPYPYDLFPMVEHKRSVRKETSRSGNLRRDLICALEESAVTLMGHTTGNYLGVTEEMQERQYSWILTRCTISIEEMDYEPRQWRIDSWFQETKQGISIETLAWADSCNWLVLARASSTLTLMNNVTKKMLPVPSEVKFDLVPEIVLLPYERYAFSDVRPAAKRPIYKRLNELVEYRKDPLHWPQGHSCPLIDGVISPWGAVSKGRLKPWGYLELLLEALPHEVDTYYRMSFADTAFTNLTGRHAVDARAQKLEQTEEETEEITFQHVLTGKSAELCHARTVWSPKPGWWLNGEKLFQRRW